MIRILGVCILLPVAVLFGILSTTRPPARADFVASSDELRTIDPHRVSYMDEIQVASALFEGLTRLNPLTLQPEPGVAEHWEHAPDWKSFTFRLRADARWSDGSPVTAADFRRAWLRVLDPTLTAQYVSLLFVLRGGEDYYRSRLDDDPENDVAAESVGVTVIDDRTLAVELAAPCSYFLDLTAFPTFAPIHEHTFQRAAATDAEGGRTIAGGGAWSRPADIRCNGVYALERWEFKRRMLLRRNTHYWDRDATNLNAIEVVMVGAPNAALIGYETGSIDLVSDLDTPVARELKVEVESGRRADFYVGLRYSTMFFRVNCQRPPLDNADLRRALSLAIDREALCRDVLGLGEAPALTYVPPVAIPMMPRDAADGRTVYYQSAQGLAADRPFAERLEMARALLARSGYDRQTAARPLELRYQSNAPLPQRICEAVQSQWERHLGIRVDLRSEERTVYGGRIRKLDYDIASSDWFGDYMDPATFLEMFTSTSGQNRTGWKNDEYDRLIAAAAREADNAKRFALFTAAERLLCEEQLPIIPLYFKTGNYLLRPGFGGVSQNVRDIVPIHRVRRMGK